jgi:hypothetical protein
MVKQLSDKQKALLREAIAEVQECRKIVREMREIVRSLQGS